MPKDWSKLDEAMRPFGPRLRDDLGLTGVQSDHYASAVASDVRAMPQSLLQEIAVTDVVGFRQRLDELRSFESFMNYAYEVQGSAGIFAPLTRAQVAYQLYIAFVYLGESCFRQLRNKTPPDSAVHKGCRFLTDFPVRGLRNAVAHSNWRYNDDFSGIIFYYFSDTESTLMKEGVASQVELDFWDKLARTTAYAALSTIKEAIS